jgi:hypothetical protein
MAEFNKFNAFVEALAEKLHNLGSDQLVVALTNTAPTAADDELADISEATYTFCSTRNITTSTSAQTSGTYKLVLTDLVLTASGGTSGPFRYVVIYNDTSTNDKLIGWYDYGSSITMADGDTFTIDFDGTAGFMTVA